MRITRVVGIVLIISCVGMLAGAAFSYFGTRGFVASAARAEGRVERLEEEPTSDGGTMYAAVVSFTDADGQEHVVRSRVLASPFLFEVGESVDVLCRPADPYNARIGSFAELWFVPLALGVAAGANLTAALFFLFALPRLARRRAEEAAPPRRHGSRTWFTVRMAALGLAGLGGALAFFDGGTSQNDSLPYWILGICVVLTVVVAPLTAAGMIGVVCLVLPKDRKWDRPSHSSPPFSFHNPLLFFHFGASLATAVGLGMVLTSVVGGFAQFLEGMGTLLGGLGFYIGVRWGMRLCQHRMAEDPN